MHIRPLDPSADLDRVTTFYKDAPDYWLLADGTPPGAQKTAEFFTDTPPNCDITKPHRLGFFLDDRLSGLAEQSFGFPNADDADLGFLMLGPWARNAGYGRRFLSHVEELARISSAPTLYLAVMESNPRGRSFWEREGFRATGLSRKMMAGSVEQTLHRLQKPLEG